MKKFIADLSERKRILKIVCNAHKQWKPRMILFAFLVITTIGIGGFFLYLVLQYSLTGENAFLFAATGICLACVPFFISLSVKNKSKYQCAFPFSSYANGTLIIEEQTLSYEFWRVGSNEPAAYSSKRAVYNDEDKFVYVIAKSDIRSLEIKDDICRIQGDGQFIMPKWAVEDTAVNSKIAQDFSFILAFTEKVAEKSIKKWLKE